MLQLKQSEKRERHCIIKHIKYLGNGLTTKVTVNNGETAGIWVYATIHAPQTTYTGRLTAMPLGGKVT